eukprot:6531815-Pyramimonas_sp.AAC.1
MNGLRIISCTSKRKDITDSVPPSRRWPPRKPRRGTAAARPARAVPRTAAPGTSHPRSVAAPLPDKHEASSSDPPMSSETRGPAG